MVTDNLTAVEIVKFYVSKRYFYVYLLEMTNILHKILIFPDELTL